MLKSSKVWWHSNDNFANKMTIYLFRALDTHDSGKLCRKIAHVITLHLRVKKSTTVKVFVIDNNCRPMGGLEFRLLHKQFGSMPVLEEAVTSWSHCSARNTQKMGKNNRKKHGAFFKAWCRTSRSIPGTSEVAVPTKKPSPCFLNVKGSFAPHFSS